MSSIQSSRSGSHIVIPEQRVLLGRLIRIFNVLFEFPRYLSAVKATAPHRRHDNAGDEPDNADGEEVVDEDSKSPTAGRDAVFNLTVFTWADAAPAKSFEAWARGSGYVGFFRGELVLAAVRSRVVFVAPVAAVVEPGGWGVGSEG